MAALVLTLHHRARGQVGDADGGLGLIHMLAAGAAGIPSNLVQAAFGLVVSTLLAMILKKNGYVRRQFPQL